MGFNNGFEHVRLENKWKKLRIQYREAGMSEEAIQEMPIHSRPPDKTSGYFLPIDPTGTPENQPSPWFSAFCKRISGVCRVAFSKQRRSFYGIL